MPMLSYSPSLWRVMQHVMTSLWTVRWERPEKSSKTLQKWDTEGSFVLLLSSCWALEGDVSLGHHSVSSEHVSQELRHPRSISFHSQWELYQDSKSIFIFAITFLTLVWGFIYLSIFFPTLSDKNPTVILSPIVF